MSLLRTLCLRSRVTGFFVFREGRLSALAQDDSEWLCDHPLRFSPLIDIDLVEEGLVEPASQVVGRATVGLVAVLDEIHRELQIPIDLREADIRRRETLENCRKLPRNVLLFLLVQLGGNDPAQVTVQELPASVLQAGLFQEELVLNLARLTDALLQLVAELLLDLSSQFGVERNALVVLDDLVLY